jgi:hypothetical protein
MASDTPTRQPLWHAAPGEPAVRGHFLRSAVAALDALALDARRPAEVTDLLPALRKARGLSWLPIAQLLPLVEAAEAELGSGGARALVLDSMRRAMGAALWRRVIMAALRAFGLSLPAMARWVPGLYALVFRDTGTMHVPDCDASQARIEFNAVPAPCFASPSYLTALGHALEFYFELSGRTGRVELLASDPGAGKLTYSIRVDASSGHARSG